LLTSKGKADVLVQHADLLHCAFILELHDRLFLDTQNHNVGAADTDLGNKAGVGLMSALTRRFAHVMVGRNISFPLVLTNSDAFLGTYNAASLADSFDSIVDLEKVTIRGEDGQSAIIRASHSCSC
jgi:hypothetical protein